MRLVVVVWSYSISKKNRLAAWSKRVGATNFHLVPFDHQWDQWEFFIGASGVEPGKNEKKFQKEIL